jgi:hexosaminidase
MPLPHWLRGALPLALLIGSTTALHPQAAAQTPPPISARDRAAIHVMPLPSSLKRGDGWLTIGPSFTVARAACRDARVGRAADRLVRALATTAPRARTRGPAATLRVTCASSSSAVPRPVEDESYSLIVSADSATLSAPTPIGALRGLETFLQLVEPRDGGTLVDRPAGGVRVPAVTIEDRPRFPWRGLMMDVSRHWMPKAVVLRNLDAMAAVKLNVLHLHLSDDQGFRVESRLYPRLQQLASDGHYYTQRDIREIVAYAADRGIRIVPEFDMPGHTTSLLVAYPDLGSAPGPYALARAAGIHDATLDPTRESTYRFLDRFYGEMASLFPDEYVHIGGDEVSSKTDWNTNARIQQFMRDHDLKDNHALQGHFNHRLVQLLATRGKKVVGWDEVLRADLDRTVVIQSWRGQEYLFQAAQQGFDAILSAGYYLDHKLPASDHYRIDPLRLANAVTITPDPARWKSWELTTHAGQTEIVSHLTMYGPPEQLRGVMEFAGAFVSIDTASLHGDTLTFQMATQYGKASMTGVVRGDSLTGKMGIVGMSLPFAGKRSGGNDMPGTTPPAVKRVPPLTAEQAKHVLGGEAAMWAEVVSAETVDSRIWPRAAAIAEKLWSPAVLTDDVNDMYRRLDIVSGLLTTRGVTHETGYPAALRALLPQGDLAPLRTLVDVLEEVKYYQRLSTEIGKDLQPSLVSLADAARPESRTARTFSTLVDGYLADPKRQKNASELRAQLIAWRDNHARLTPLLANANQADDLRTLSEQLSKSAAAGLAALDALSANQRLSADDAARFQTVLTAASASRAAVTNTAIPAIMRLVDKAT